MDLIQLTTRREFLRQAAVGAVAAGVLAREAVDAATTPPRRHHWSIAYCASTERPLGWIKSSVVTSAGTSVSVAPSSVLISKRRSRTLMIGHGSVCCGWPLGSICIPPATG